MTEQDKDFHMIAAIGHGIAALGACYWAAFPLALGVGWSRSLLILAAAFYLVGLARHVLRLGHDK